MEKSSRISSLSMAMAVLALGLGWQFGQPSEVASASTGSEQPPERTPLAQWLTFRATSTKVGSLQNQCHTLVLGA